MWFALWLFFVAGVRPCEAIGQADAPALDERVSNSCPSFQAIQYTADIAGDRVTFADLDLPDPISAGDLERYRRLLELSEAQVEALRRLHASYCIKCTELKSDSVDPLYRRANKQQADAAEPSSVAYESLIKDREMLIRRLSSLDSALLTEFAAALGEGQLENLVYVQADRARQVCGRRLFHAPIYPEAGIDLVALLEEMQFDDGWSREVIAVLREYVLALHSRICNAARRVDDVYVKSRYLLEQLQQLPDDLEARIARGKPIEDEYADLGRIKLAENRWLRETNKRFLPRFEAALGEKYGERLRREFERRTYPMLYGDGTSAEPDIQALLAIESLTGEQREAMGTIAGVYRQQYRRMCDEAEACVCKWYERILGGHPVHPDEIAAHKEKLESMKRERAELRTSVLKQMTDLLTPEQHAAMLVLRDIPLSRDRDRAAKRDK